MEGDSGSEAIVAGDPDTSELIKRITTHDENTQMPPEGDRLSKEDITKLKRWIAQGAKWPDDGTGDDASNAAAKHWSFQPIASPNVPVADEWSQHPIDRFLQQARNERDVTATADADARTVLRRLSYDLLGLPPTLD